jgi:hypothetical protein
MMSDEIRKTEPHLLSRLMALDPSAAPGWDRGELGAVLRHQLAVPLRSGLGAPLDELDRRLAESGGFQGLGAMSFGDLLLHPRPPIEALKLVKDFGKILRRSESAPLLPREIATVIYYASIAAAGLRCGVSISRLDPEKLKKGFRWALSQPWLDESIRRLFEEEAKRLGELQP